MGGAIAAAIEAGFYVWYPPEGGTAGEFADQCCDVLKSAGMRESRDPAYAALAIAPCLSRKLSEQEYSAPNWGTLIFHPSILPAHRGPDAIRWTMHNREPVSGVTWFWANDEFDAGPIAAQEPVVIDYRLSPRNNYASRFIPAGLRALNRVVAHYRKFRSMPRREQEHELATRDRKRKAA